MTFKDRYAVITGGGTGIGKAAAIRFARDGAVVALWGRRRDVLEGALAELPGRGHLAMSVDVSDAGAVERGAANLRDAWGRVDILVNNAAISAAADPVTAPLAQWQAPLRINFDGAVHCVRAIVPLMPPEGGRIINVTSVHDCVAERGASAYAAAKGALKQYTRGLAVDLAAGHILVNAVAPGFVDTPMSVSADGVNELHSDWFRKNYVEGHHLPLRRAAQPEEIAGAIAFLAGPDATYITGTTLYVDGGLLSTF